MNRPATEGTIRVWALETRGAAAGTKTHCKWCGQRITWFHTVKNHRPIPIDGHEPVPLRSERDVETGATIDIHDRATVHFATCPKAEDVPRTRGGRV